MNFPSAIADALDLQSRDGQWHIPRELVVIDCDRFDSRIPTNFVGTTTIEGHTLMYRAWLETVVYLRTTGRRWVWRCTFDVEQVTEDHQREHLTREEVL